MTFRVDLVTALVSLLNTYKTANPTLLRDVHTARPAHIGETPIAWIGNRNESEVHDSGTRTRVISVDVVIADVVPDNEQAAGRMDVLWDALVDVFTAAPHMVSGSSVVEVTTIAEGETDYGTVPYRILVISVTANLIEGRN